MAYDAVVDRTKLRAELTKIADAIRRKNYGTGTLDFYNGDFTKAINNMGSHKEIQASIVFFNRAPFKLTDFFIRYFDTKKERFVEIPFSVDPHRDYGVTITVGEGFPIIIYNTSVEATKTLFYGWDTHDTSEAYWLQGYARVSASANYYPAAIHAPWTELHLYPIDHSQHPVPSSFRTEVYFSA